MAITLTWTTSPTLQHVVDAADAVVVQLADVAQAVAAGHDLDERAEILDRRDLAVVDLADLDLLAEGLDLGQRGLGAGGVAVRDVDRAVVVDVDLRAGRFLNALDRLAAGADRAGRSSPG